ncbi:helix-hairpin-helix domain-containing protein [Neorhizobium sp. T6_25]|uniref:helix-hairpin-helix domain-containing protein n=1 Tax=Neorhizobium sp. T6_25 TaxID=2093833 RepID=UPI000CFA6DAD|nr:topoisomerase DNA-binding C4 zinc finger domain-containing protein [Neorhizobium sp. T6_25]
MSALDKLFADGSTIELGNRIGKGGEGEVFAVTSLPGFALKAYLPGVVASRETKIRAMVSANLHSKMASVAFPTKVVVDKGGTFVGFLMRLVPDHKEIHELQTPSSRLRHFPSADYRFLVRTAVNVAKAFGQVHVAGCVIGDINQRSILVSDSATVALIDTDSFQVTQGGQQFLCVVGVPDYTPPELQGQSLKTIVRTPNHDAFGLAVAIFQLLCMDRHPFAGRYKGSGDITIEQAIKEFRFAYSSRDTKMDPPPASVALRDLSPKTAENFERAFSPNGVVSRPTPDQWIDALTELETSLRPCTLNKAHHYSRFASECPWCRMEQAFGVPMFVVRDSTSIHIPKGLMNDTIGFSFNIGAIRAVLTSNPLPLQIAIAIPKPQRNYSTSNDVKNAQTSNGGWSLLANVGKIGLAASFIAMFALPKGIFGVIGMAISFFLITIGGSSKSTGIDIGQKYNIAAEKVRSRIQFLQSNAPVTQAFALKAEIEKKISEYEKLVEDFKDIEKDYNSVRQKEQLDAYLSAHTIRGAKSAKLSVGDVASLASYSFTTAYDAKTRDVQSAYGIGPVKAGRIAAWVKSVESRFQFRVQYTDADRNAIQVKKATIVSRQQGCADSLNKLVEDYRKHAKAVNDYSGGNDVQLQQYVEEVAQAEADLLFLKIAIPGIKPVPPHLTKASSYQPTPQPRYSPRNAPKTSTSTYQATAPSASGTPSCPICGSQMRYRTAKRGHRAGRPFWGCSRYPTCRGTRIV